MIYKAKEGSKAYEYIKSICEAEDKEFKAYVKRVEDSVGFELDKFGGYMPDSTLLVLSCPHITQSQIVFKFSKS